MSEHYTIGSWHGYTTYRCAYCRMSSFEESELIDHINSRHMHNASIRPSDSGLVDKSGSPVQVVDVEDPPEPPIQRGQGIDVEAPVENRNTGDDEEDQSKKRFWQ